MKTILSTALIIICLNSKANTFLTSNVFEKKQSIMFQEPAPKSTISRGLLSNGGSLVASGGILLLLSGGITLINVSQDVPRKPLMYVSSSIGMLGALFITVGGFKISNSVKVAKSKSTTFKYGIDGSGATVALQF